MNNRRGQILIETVLIMAVLIGATLTISRQFQDQNIIAQLVSGPWKSLAGMIQNGVWGPSQDTMSQHPNNFSRVTTPEGEAPQ